MIRARFLALALLAPLALLATSACSDEAGAPARQGSAAAGEIAGGSISDAMIPLEQLQSQAPLAPPQAQGDTSADLDAEQPEVVQAEGVEGTPPSEGAEAAPAAPAPTQPQE